MFGWYSNRKSYDFAIDRLPQWLGSFRGTTLNEGVNIPYSMVAGFYLLLCKAWQFVNLISDISINLIPFNIEYQNINIQ